MRILFLPTLLLLTGCSLMSFHSEDKKPEHRTREFIETNLLFCTHQDDGVFACSEGPNSVRIKKSQILSFRPAYANDDINEEFCEAYINGGTWSLFLTCVDLEARLLE